MNVMEFMPAPPATNRGAQSTRKRQKSKWLRACVDWVSFTFFRLEMDDIFGLFLFDKDEFVDLESGGYGYSFTKVCGHIKVYYSLKAEKGIHVVFSGQGCRQYEARKNKREWSQIFLLAFDLGANIPRLDVTVDDFKTYFKLKRLVGKMNKGEVVMKFKSWEPREKKKSDGTSKGITIEYGSKMSDIFLIMYEKDKEREAKGEEYQLPEGAGGWNRLEFRLRNERAMVAAWWIANGHCVGELVVGMLNHYVRFVDRTDDKNKSRWPTSSFWKKFIKDVEPVRLTQIGIERSLRKGIDHISRQNRLLAAIVEGEGMELIEKMIEEGRKRLRPEDIQMIESYKKSLADASRKTDDDTNN